MVNDIPSNSQDSPNPAKEATGSDALSGEIRAFEEGRKRGLRAGFDLGKAVMLSLVSPLLDRREEISVTPDRTVPIPRPVEVVRHDASDRLTLAGQERALRLSFAMTEKFHRFGANREDFGVVAIPKPQTGDESPEEDLILVHSASEGLKFGSPVMPASRGSRIGRFLDKPVREAMTIVVGGQSIDTRVHTTEAVLTQVARNNSKIHEFDWVTGRPGHEGRNNSYVGILVGGLYISGGENYMGPNTVLHYRPSAHVETIASQPPSGDQ